MCLTRLCTLLLALTTMRSPTSALMVGHGHCPFMPITRLACLPSGLALLTNVISQFRLIVFAETDMVDKRKAQADSNEKTVIMGVE